ncbi:MAG: RIP metalloprotease RseP [Acidobacteria bacterium]|nr:RIP metalloprotease RseP [Acidobacteriota bacterium]MBV9186238.1 RIP metalloprotease RseP [Acidobacteriota bacterium]
MQTIATNLAGIIIVLGFLVFAHESGHFFVAKLFRVRVLVFSLGFGKRLFGFRKGATDYRVSLVPLGGYVRMAGDTPEENQPANPEEFLSKPKWQRFLILVAGPFMNIVIAIAFIAIISMVGTESIIVKPVIGEVMAGKPAARAGLLPGDRVVAIDGEKINDFDDLRMNIGMHGGTPVRVDYLRGGQLRSTVMTPEREESEFGPIGKAGLWPYLDTTLGRVTAGSPAAAAGLRTGDRIVTVNGHPVSQLKELDVWFDAAKKSAIALDVVRGNERFHTTLPVVATFDPNDPYRGFMPPTEVKKLSLIPALKDSVQQNWKMLRYAFITLGRLFRAEGSVKELSGPISIARISGAMVRRGVMPVVALMAMISLQLGIMNLLPIPVLDGGHIMILLIEGVARRDLSLRVKERIQQVGFAVLAALMIVVIYNDVITNVMRKG